VLSCVPARKCLRQYTQNFPLFSLTSELSTQISSIAEKTVQSIGARGMVVGHTPQLNGANWYVISTGSNF